MLTLNKTPRQRYTESQLKRMKKDALFALCLKHFGYDTASIYAHYSKDELIGDLLTVTF